VFDLDSDSEDEGVKRGSVPGAEKGDAEGSGVPDTTFESESSSADNQSRPPVSKLALELGDTYVSGAEMLTLSSDRNDAALNTIETAVHRKCSEDSILSQNSSLATPTGGDSAQNLLSPSKKGASKNVKKDSRKSFSARKYRQTVADEAETSRLEAQVNSESCTVANSGEPASSKDGSDVTILLGSQSSDDRVTTESITIMSSSRVGPAASRLSGIFGSVEDASGEDAAPKEEIEITVASPSTTLDSTTSDNSSSNNLNSSSPRMELTPSRAGSARPLKLTTLQAAAQSTGISLAVSTNASSTSDAVDVLVDNMINPPKFPVPNSSPAPVQAASASSTVSGRKALTINTQFGGSTSSTSSGASVVSLTPRRTPSVSVDACEDLTLRG
jgi:hypothetical protein